MAGFGRFEGTVRTEWFDDGRRMRLLADFAYVDHYRIRWEAPRGWIVDGASIPQLAWSVIGGPFEGRYRKASVIHDVACDQRNRSWESVHEAFYNAMRLAGEDIIRAKVMYGAVYHFGPRWPLFFSTLVPADKVDSFINETAFSFGPHSRVKSVVLPQVKRLRGARAAQASKVDFVVTPLTKRLSVSDFFRLQKAIGKKNLSLEQIRNF